MLKHKVIKYQSPKSGQILCAHKPHFLMPGHIYDNILDMIQITDKKLLHFKLSKSGQIICVDKTCFPRPGHICKSNLYTQFMVTMYILLSSGWE